jgi:hypothetical protein
VVDALKIVDVANHTFVAKMVEAERLVVDAVPVIFTLPNVAPLAESAVAEAFTRLACDT